MNAPKLIKRKAVGGYKYTQCTNCETEIEIDRPKPDRYYICGKCDLIIEHRNHNYCGFCGERIDWEHKID